MNCYRIVFQLKKEVRSKLFVLESSASEFKLAGFAWKI